jgi:transaldolase
MRQRRLRTFSGWVFPGTDRRRCALDGRPSAKVRGVLDSLRTKIFADGAEIAQIERLAADPLIRGFTTNPTLMWKAGLTDYTEFAKRILDIVTDRPISFEVFADEEDEMRRQAEVIASWADNVFIKIPVTDTRGNSTANLVRELSNEGVQVNVTALMLRSQVETVTAAVADGAPCFISVFAGRVADAGVDPLPLMRDSLEIMRAAPLAELIWASPREVFNVVQASDIGCHIITVTNDILAKLTSLGRDLGEFSLDTVRMFHRDAAAAGFWL